MIVRSSRPLHSQPRRYSRTLRAALVAASLVGVLSGTAASFDAHAQASAAIAASASAASASSPGISAGGTQYTVKPGQSVTDVAGEITGSTDRTVRDTMARALFDANPNAFMHHDPSKMRLGAVLTIPSTGDGSAGASGSVAASAPAAVAAASGPAAAVVAPAAAAASVTPASTAAAVSTPAAAMAAPAASTVKEASSVESAAAPSGVASNVNGTLEGASASASGAVAVGASGGVGASDAAVATSEAQPVASSPAVANPVPVSTASTQVADEGSDRLPIGLFAGIAILVALLVLAWRLAKRRRYARSEAERVAVEQGSSGESPVVSTQRRLSETPDAPLAEHSDVPATTGAADLEGVAVQRDQSELNGVAASIESYEAAQSFETPSEDDAVPEPSAEGHVENIVDETASPASAPARDEDARRAPFMPDAPAALHRAFTPPRPGSVEAERIAAEKAAAEQEAAEREAALREQAQAREQAEREAVEAQARAAAQREAEAREQAEREAREADARAVAQREADAREAEAREAAEREQAQREAHEAEA
ncbi:MAG: hypothetical protein WCA53_20330, partial [Caballeronia sp.]